MCAAYYLTQRGASITLIEKGEIASGASYGNAGWVVPSHSIPLPTPDAVMVKFENKTGLGIDFIFQVRIVAGKVIRNQAIRQVVDGNLLYVFVLDQQFPVYRQRCLP